MEFAVKFRDALTELPVLRSDSTRAVS